MRREKCWGADRKKTIHHSKRGNPEGGKISKKADLTCFAKVTGSTLGSDPRKAVPCLEKRTRVLSGGKKGGLSGGRNGWREQEKGYLMSAVRTGSI